MPAVSALQEQLHFHDGDCITQHSLSNSQSWCRYRKITHKSLPVLNLKAQAKTFMARPEFQRKHKNYSMCLERIIMYHALSAVSGRFMKYWSQRCKKFSCTSLKNIFSFHSSCQLVFCFRTPSAQGSLKLRPCRLPGVESIPGGALGMSGQGTPGSGLVEKLGITHSLGSMALEDFSNINECVCFLLLFLKNAPFFFSVYMILQWLSRPKKILFLFSPTTKTLSLLELLLFHGSEQRHSF